MVEETFAIVAPTNIQVFLELQIVPTGVIVEAVRRHLSRLSIHRTPFQFTDSVYNPDIAFVLYEILDINRNYH